ncbi:class I SAM-dependent methyltransferase [Kiloniella antarctica]|uniref:Class I SAM-dependent methyltransferase n=1 Tax=Kiloniella antarctica TaxID=1550907 RepID=A0ABW5BLM4_9PROT
MAPTAKFWDRMANRYSKSPVADETSYQKKLQITQGYFKPDMEILELGCGTGTTAIIHAPFVRHIRAVDISSNMLKIAQDKVDKADIQNITFEHSTIEDLSIPDQSMDAVLAMSVLHLLEDKEAAITNAHRMLKPGGLFITSTVCLAGSMGWFKPVVAIGKIFNLLPLVKFFTPQDLSKSLSNAGFEIDHSWQPGKGKSVFIVARRIN